MLNISMWFSVDTLFLLASSWRTPPTVNSLCRRAFDTLSLVQPAFLLLVISPLVTPQFSAFSRDVPLHSGHPSAELSSSLGLILAAASPLDIPPMHSIRSLLNGNETV